MIDAPWDYDDVTVLRDKWRIANQAALTTENLANALEICVIETESHPRNDQFIDQQISFAGQKIIECAQLMYPEGLTKEDWIWFCKKHMASEISAMGILAGSTLEAQEKVAFLSNLARFSRKIAGFTRIFANAIGGSLKSRQNGIGPSGWFQKTSDGVQLFGKKVSVSGQPLLVLECLCHRVGKHSTYEKLAEYVESWQDGLDRCTSKSTKANIRTAVSAARKALISAFSINNKSDDPIKAGGSKGWMLDTAILQKFSGIASEGTFQSELHPNSETTASNTRPSSQGKQKLTVTHPV